MSLAGQLNATVDGEILEEDSKLTLKAYDVGHTTEDFLRAAIRLITGKYARADLAPSLEIILKELTTNAAKANFKKLFFAERALELENPDQYRTGVALFRELFSARMFREYGHKAKAARLEVATTFDYNADRIIIRIKNNVPMSSAEEKRVREKLKMAMGCTDVGSFILENIDESEGAGLGLMLCITALRAIGVDPRLFTIATDQENYTTAKVEIPLHNDYVPLRVAWSAN